MSFFIQAGVGRGKCFRCGGDHLIEDCDISAEEVRAAFRLRREKAAKEAAEKRDAPSNDSNPTGDEDEDEQAQQALAIVPYEEMGDIDAFW